MATIALEGMEFYAYHGHYDEELVVGTQFVVDLWVDADCNQAGISDLLEDTIDYQALYAWVRQEVEVSSKLLEHVAYRVANSLLSNLPSIEKVTVKVAKLNPHLGGKVKQSSIMLTKARNELAQ